MKWCDEHRKIKNTFWFENQIWNSSLKFFLSKRDIQFEITSDALKIVPTSVVFYYCFGTIFNASDDIYHAEMRAYKELHR